MRPVTVVVTAVGIGFILGEPENEKKKESIKREHAVEVEEVGGGGRKEIVEKKGKLYYLLFDVILHYFVDIFPRWIFVKRKIYII